MKQGCFALLAMLALAAPGCQNSAQNVALLERDLRWQEDEIYYLQDQLNEYEQRLDSCRRENATLKKDAGVSDGSSYNPRKELGNFPNGPRRNDSKSAPSKGSEAPDFMPPSVELPGEPSTTPPPRAKMGDSASLGGSAIIPVSSTRVVQSEDCPADDEITEIFLRKLLSGGENIDGRAGDDGIMVVFEPRNSAGKLVPVAGETSIVLLDPKLDGEASRIARWDFATDEVVTHFKKTLLAKGFQFELRWTNAPPRNPDLKLYVRFITPTGKRLIAEKDIHLHLAGAEEKDHWVRLDDKSQPPRRVAPGDVRPQESEGPRPASRPAERPPLTAQRPEPNTEPGAPEWTPFR
ncbi:MAG TPA: hypothetical protein VFE24_07675 [Pirellulales bacterium]|jgi:hypothetical protein|nr:hypothetical protein [Pirellulales bacterium]